MQCPHCQARLTTIDYEGVAIETCHRREDEQPFRPELAAALRTHLASKLPNALAFAMPNRTETPKMLREDLKAAGIAYRDDSGRVVDFHALRHTFISNLARGGVHPKTAQTLARPGTIGLTMDRYSHSLKEDERSALAVLPDIDVTPDHEQRATGTDDSTCCLARDGSDKLGSVQYDSAQSSTEAEESQGGVAERLNAPVLKTGIPFGVSRVRIPPPPLEEGGEACGNGVTSSRRCPCQDPVGRASVLRGDGDSASGFGAVFGR